MAFTPSQAARDIASAALVWCGVDTPTPTELTAAELAAGVAIEAINEIRLVDELEDAYKFVAVEIAAYLFSKRGVDGVTGFSENGVQRSYEKGSIPPSMLARVVPKATAG